jgi:hypothetical protein
VAQRCPLGDAAARAQGLRGGGVAATNLGFGSAYSQDPDVDMDAAGGGAGAAGAAADGVLSAAAGWAGTRWRQPRFALVLRADLQHHRRLHRSGTVAFRSLHAAAEAGGADAAAAASALAPYEQLLFALVGECGAYFEETRRAAIGVSGDLLENYLQWCGAQVFPPLCRVLSNDQSAPADGAAQSVVAVPSPMTDEFATGTVQVLGSASLSHANRPPAIHRGCCAAHFKPTHAPGAGALSDPPSARPLPQLLHHSCAMRWFLGGSSDSAPDGTANVPLLAHHLCRSGELVKAVPTEKQSALQALLCHLYFEYTNRWQPLAGPRAGVCGGAAQHGQLTEDLLGMLVGDQEQGGDADADGDKAMDEAGAPAEAEGKKGGLHWRYQLMVGCWLLLQLPRPDSGAGAGGVPAPLLKWLLRALGSKMQPIRHLALQGLHSVVLLLNSSAASMAPEDAAARSDLRAGLMHADFAEAFLNALAQVRRCGLLAAARLRLAPHPSRQPLTRPLCRATRAPRAAPTARRRRARATASGRQAWARCSTRSPCARLRPTPRRATASPPRPSTASTRTWQWRCGPSCRAAPGARARPSSRWGSSGWRASPQSWPSA